MSLVLLLPLPGVRNDHLRMTSADFDSKPLERGAKLLREISAYRNAKKQEETKQVEQVELAANAAEYKDAIMNKIFAFYLSMLCGGLQAILTEQNKLVVVVGGAPALVVLFHTYVWDLPIVVEDMLSDDVDSAMAHHNVELLEFPLPGKEECFKLLKLYLDKYTADDTLMEAAAKIEGICRSIQALAEKETCSNRRRKREIQE
ncbi:hypothetical protein CUMW_257690 [Citrus unshiu]|uniref:ATPase family AAA domain-containing protein n=1 Tax=Citrus unshiu TaxID=55188 RepID=A0A2H5QSM0_CITUN|nr:hypothetical protein CUMW_257690 [Citrus unshiu]